MLISHNWLQKYFDQPLPAPEKLAELFTFRAFEVDGMEKKGSDTIYDLKVLPDRAHYCLCHKGVAGEVSAILGIPLRKSEIPPFVISETRELSVTIEDPKACRRSTNRIIENVTITDSPDWLRETLASLGQRSINTVVDASNCVMFDKGNPLHAFDADKVVGDIVVRYAKEGEPITLLGGKELLLSPAVLVIADNVGPLDIAGIKGGKRAEVTHETKNIILEAANFDPTLIRRTSTALGIRTDASKRFENELSPDVALLSMEHFTALVLHLSPGARAGKLIDTYPSPKMPWSITIAPEKISDLLGTEVPEKEIVRILESLNMEVVQSGTDIIVTPPSERLDIAIPEDLVEEVGRLYGFEKIKGVPLRETSFKPKTNGHYAASNLLRSSLIKRGFSEIYGYSLTDKGHVELQNPLASDKSHLRTDLTTGLRERLKSNFSHTLFDKDSVRLFEIGKSFPKEGERLSVAFGSIYKNKKLSKSREDVDAVIADIEAAFGMKLPPAPITARTEDDTSTVVEIPLGDKIRDMKNIPAADLSFAMHPDTKFKPYSLYPRIIRDVALFAAPGTDPEKVAGIIKVSMGQLVAEGPYLFDRFEKGDKVSLAYRMVFQSSERTLSDDEVNAVMNQIIAALEKEGFEVRK